MERYVSLDKRSKKDIKKFYSARRNIWVINPVTRIVPNGKTYNRQKSKKEVAGYMKGME